MTNMQKIKKQEGGKFYIISIFNTYIISISIFNKHNIFFLNIYMLVFVFIYTKLMYRVYIYYVNIKLFFWMRLIAINHLTALILVLSND